jgi:hypothetical protein
MEVDDPARAVGMDDRGDVALRREGLVPLADGHPGVEAVHQDDAAGRRRRRRQQERVVAARPHPRDRARGEPAEAVGLEPLGVVRIGR